MRNVLILAPAHVVYWQIVLLPITVPFVIAHWVTRAILSHNVLNYKVRIHDLAMLYIQTYSIYLSFQWINRRKY